GGGGGGPTAEAASLSGDSGTAVMEQFNALGASQQAATFSTLSGGIDTALESRESTFQEGLPEVEVELDTGVEPGEEGEIERSEASSDVGEDTPGPTPEPEMAPTPETGAAEKPDVSNFLSGWSTSSNDEEGAPPADTSGNAQAISRAISSIPTSDGDVETSPGPAPKIPLVGETDPNRVGNQSDKAAVEANTALTDNLAAVDVLPGRERVPELKVSEVHDPREGLEAMLGSPEVEVPSDAQGYVDLGLDAAVAAAFDGLNSAEMQATMAAAVTEVSSAETDLDAGREEQLSTFETDRETALDEARADGEKEVDKARKSIDDEKAKTKRAQQKARADVESKVTAERSKTLTSIDAKVAETDKDIQAKFDEAKRTAEAKVAEGEVKAAEEKRRSEEEAEDKSWWESACDFVADCLEALAEAVTVIFDAVRSAVTAVIDAVKEVATTLIDAAVNFVNDAIGAFGEFLKGAIQGLLGDLFPELADALCEFVDDAVDKAQEAVTAVGEALKTGITALLDTLKDGLNALLSVFEGLVQGALALATAIMTGNWTEFLLMALEAALSLAGISPDEFYAFVGRAEETIDIIVNDPGAFLSNCINALSTGFGQFSDNFMGHLETGFVEWMTGTVGEAGITMPETLDMAGVFDISLQVLGLTPDHLREKATEHVGEDAVEAFDFVWGFIESTIEGGLDGLWDHVQEYLGDLWDMVIGEIQDWLMEKIVIAAVTKLATMFNPVGAIVQAIMTAWNLYTFVRDQIQRIYGVFTAVVNGIGDIARGSIGPAANMVEGALAGLVPVAIDLLAKLLGLGGMGAKVQGVIEGVQERVDEAINKLIEKVKGMFSGGGGSSEGSDQEGGTNEHDPESETSGGFEITLPRKSFTDEQGENHELYSSGGEGAVSLLVASPAPQDRTVAVDVGGHMSSVDGDAEARVKTLTPQVAEKFTAAKDKERQSKSPGGTAAETAQLQEDAQKLKSEGETLMNQLVAALGSTTGASPEEKLRMMMNGFPDLEKVIANIPPHVMEMEDDALARAVSEGQVRAQAWEQWSSANVFGFLQEVADMFGEPVAKRKLGEINNDTQVGQTAAFFGAVKDAVKRSAAGMTQSIPVLSAMRSAASTLNLYKKGTQVSISGDLWRVANFDSFWGYNIDPSTKNDIFKGIVGPAEGLTVSEVDEATQHLLAREHTKKTGSWGVGSPTYTGSVGGGNGTTWWTDSNFSEALDRVTDATTDLEAFTDLCEVAALQPSWYASGVARFAVDGGGIDMRKPTAYDGLMSEYWVQAENEKYWGVTGGGQREWVAPFVDASKIKTSTVHASGNAYDTVLAEFRDKGTAEGVDTTNAGDEATAAANDPGQGGRTNEQYIRQEPAPTGGLDNEITAANETIGTETGTRQDNAAANGGNLTTGLPTRPIEVEETTSGAVNLTVKEDTGESFTGGSESHTIRAEDGDLTMHSVTNTVRGHMEAASRAVARLEEGSEARSNGEAGIEKVRGQLTKGESLAKKLEERQNAQKKAKKAGNGDEAKEIGKEVDSTIRQLDGVESVLATAFISIFNALKAGDMATDGSEGLELDTDIVEYERLSKLDGRQLVSEAGASWSNA
ncbi:MAG: hypothetical protein AB8H79_13500, partial [Myxococcota bacterium]